MKKKHSISRGVTGETRAAIVKDALSGKLTFAEIASRYEIESALIHQWLRKSPQAAAYDSFAVKRATELKMPLDRTTGGLTLFKGLDQLETLGQADIEKLERNLCEIMYEVRKLRGITQTEVAAKVGCTQGALSKWERGTMSITAADWFRFCKCLGIDPRSPLVGEILWTRDPPPRGNIAKTTQRTTVNSSRAVERKRAA